MRIEFVQSVAGANFDYQPGQFVDLSADLARPFLKAGQARPAEAEAAGEAAVAGAPENAAVRHARGRKRGGSTGLFPS